jgi:hypothetical protein
MEQNYKLKLFWLFFAVLLVGMEASLIWSIHSYGCATLPDSAAYLSMARSFYETGQLNLFDGSPSSMWPPLYSMTIGLLGVFGPVTPEGVPFIAGCIGLAVILLACARAALFVYQSWLARFSIVALTACSTTIMMCMSGLLSEVIFIPALTIFLVTLFVPQMEPGRRMAWLFCCAAVATLARYTGVMLYLFAGGYYITLLARPAYRSWRLFFRVLIAGALSCVPVVLMFTRNILSTGYLTGPATPVEYTVQQHLASGFDTLSQFLFPGFIPLWVRLASLGGLMFVMLGLAIHTLRQRDRRHESRLFLLCVVWSAFYFLLTLLISQTRHTDVLDFRMLAPVHLPLWFMIVWLCDQLICSASKRRRWARIAGSLLLCFFLMVSLHRMVKRIRDTGRTGWGMYTCQSYANNDLVQWLREDPTDRVLFSNAHDVVYLLSQRQVFLLPVQNQAAIEAFRDRLARMKSPAYLVWFNDFWRQYPATPTMLANAGLILVAEQEFRAGTTYRIELPELLGE